MAGPSWRSSSVTSTWSWRAGDALELKVQVPAESEHHVWLAYDSLETPSRFVFDAE